MSLIKKLTADLTAKIKTDSPNPYRLADAEDDLTWDRQKQGTMAEAATNDTEVKTFIYEGDD